MENINKIIGNNLNRYRKGKGLSLEKVSEMTGVSKGMIGQIERGETNPSISTLWKIANGLHISSTFLFEEDPAELILIKKNEISPMSENNDKYNVFPTFTFDHKKKFEVLVVDLVSGCCHNSEPHENGVEEYIYVCQGQFKLIIENDTYVLSEGDSIKFLADKFHTYQNESNSLCTIHSIIYYNQ